jgi:hypothetical protein
MVQALKGNQAMIVRVFRNLTRGLWSIQARKGSSWHTIAHASSVVLADASFIVNEAGRLRTIRTGRKTIHAYVKGNLLGYNGIRRKPCIGFPAPDEFKTGTNTGQEITYNPKLYSSFVKAWNGEAIKNADYVHFVLDPYPSVSYSGIHS